MTLSDQMVEAAARALRDNNADELGLPLPGRWEDTGAEFQEYWRKRAPAASPEIVRGLVEALEGMQAAVKSLPPSAALRLSDDLVTRFLRVDGRATAMLKAAKEAGL